MSRNILTGLVGAWCPSLGPSGYTLLDRSGRSRHASLDNFSGNPWSAVAGGWSVQFAGSSANRAVCGSAILSGTGDFTITAWVNPTTISGTALDLHAAGNYGSGNTTGVQIGGYNSLAFGYCSSGASLFSTSSVSAGVWFYVGFIRSGGVCTLYLNGKAEATGTRAGSIGTGRNWSIGAPADTNAGHGSSIDDQGTWSRAITAPEMWQLYQLGRGGLGRLLTQRAQRRVFRAAQGNRRRRLICGAEC
jgi:hypothetical protein